MKYVLDTNTLIYFFKGMGGVAAKLLQQQPADIGIPAVVLFELEVGIAKSPSPRRRRAQLEELRSLVNVLPLDENSAKAAAQVRAKLEAQGRPIGPYDVLIAGTAIAARSVLVTRNTREFARIPGLKTENWF